MLDRHEQKDAGPADVWADPDDLNNLHGPRRFEGRCNCVRSYVQGLWGWVQAQSPSALSSRHSTAVVSLHHCCVLLRLLVQTHTRSCPLCAAMPLQVFTESCGCLLELYGAAQGFQCTVMRANDITCAAIPLQVLPQICGCLFELHWIVQGFWYTVMQANTCSCLSCAAVPAGSPSELREEVGRLSARLANLEAAEPTMQAIKPDPEMDAEGLWHHTIACVWSLLLGVLLGTLARS
jgi:hypothetical protein